ncbi:hypothetical protein Tco_0101285, partial [Tanacetum coccineum]
IQVSDGLGHQKRLIFLPYVLGHPQQDLEEKGVIDSGCSRHMIGNMSYLTDFEETDGGYVIFVGNPKGGKIIGRVFSLNDTECIVLSPNFKLTDESQVLLKVPRKNNMYSVDSKGTSDESELWHRRLRTHKFQNYE